MKAWKNEKDNWCFEFERKEAEEERLIMLVSSGVYDGYKKTYEDNPKSETHLKAYLSAKFFNYILQVVFVGENYTQSHPTIDKPMVFRAKDALKAAIRNFNHDYTEAEVKYLKRIEDVNDIL